MYWDDQVMGHWSQFAGAVKTRWVLLTEEDLTIISGRRDRLIVLIQERYGISRDEVNGQVDEWEHAQSAADLEVTR